MVSLKILMHVISDRDEYFDLLTRFLSTYGEFMQITAY